MKARPPRNKDVAANAYGALLDAWYRCSADDRRRFLCFIGAQFIDEAGRASEAKAVLPPADDGLDIPDYLRRVPATKGAAS